MERMTCECSHQQTIWQGLWKKKKNWKNYVYSPTTFVNDHMCSERLAKTNWMGRPTANVWPSPTSSCTKPCVVCCVYEYVMWAYIFNYYIAVLTIARRILTWPRNCDIVCSHTAEWQSSQNGFNRDRSHVVVYNMLTLRYSHVL